MSTESDLAQFSDQGFAVLPDLLDLPAVVQLSRAINADVKAHPFMWNQFPGSVVNRNALLSVPGIDQVALHPRVRAMVDEIFGGDARFEEAVVLVYHPGGEPTPIDWHRDVPHNRDNLYRAEYVQLLVYLSDVTDDAHKFAIFPESRHEPVTDDDALVTGADAFEFVGRPGSAILFNSSSLHGVVKVPAGRGRRSLHIYYGHKDRPSSSESTIVPQRVVRSLDPKGRTLFEKRNRLSTLIFE